MEAPAVWRDLLLLLISIHTMQASCNDWHLDSELSSAYLLEKLVGSMGKAGVEGGSPDDGADTWVATPYAMLEPCTIQGPHDLRLTGQWRRPWADEMKVGCPSTLVCLLICSTCCMSSETLGIS